MWMYGFESVCANLCVSASLCMCVSLCRYVYECVYMCVSLCVYSHVLLSVFSTASVRTWLFVRRYHVCVNVCVLL